jgi:hypothetical protein
LSYSKIRTCLIATTYVNFLKGYQGLLIQEYLEGSNLKILAMLIIEFLRLIFRSKQGIVTPHTRATQAITRGIKFPISDFGGYGASAARRRRRRTQGFPGGEEGSEFGGHHATRDSLPI